MGSASSLARQPVVEQCITLTIQTPNVLALMDSDGASGLAYQLIYKEWACGIENVEDVHYVHVFNLNERPFASPLLSLGKAHITAGAHARQSFCHLLGRFDELGIKLIASVYTGKIFCRTTLFFERSTPLELNSDQQKTKLNCPAEERFMCISLRSKNILQLPMVPAIGRIHYEFIRTEFASSLLSEEKTGEFLEFTFKGQPFGNTNSRYEEMITSKRLFLSLVRHFSSNGYQFIAGLSIKGGYKNDTMFFKSTRRVPDTEVNYFLVSAEERNRLRIFEAPTEAVEIIRESIASGNVKEIKQSYMGCVEIILQSTPFDTFGPELTDTQIQFMEIIDRLWQTGYELRGAVQTSLGVYDKSSFLFETSKEMPRAMFGISMARSDTIKLLKAKTNIKTLIRELVLAVWPKGIQNEYDIKMGYAIKLRGRPFSSRDTGADSHEGLHLLSCIVEKLKAVGWQLKTSFDVGAKLVNEEESHAHSPDGVCLLFVKERFNESSSNQNNNSQIHGII